MASSQEVISFRLNYAEFKALSDADVSAALDDADVWLDPYMWSLRDYPTARALWAAHNLQVLAILMANQAAMGDLLGFSNQSIATVGFGERRVAFKQYKQTAGEKGVKAGPWDELNETWYGQRFKMLMSRNIIPIMTI